MLGTLSVMEQRIYLEHHHHHAFYLPEIYDFCRTQLNNITDKLIRYNLKAKFEVYCKNPEFINFIYCN